MSEEAGRKSDLASVGSFAPESLVMIRALYDTTDERLLELMQMPYADYLQTAEWQELRRSMVRAAGFRCQWCSTNRQRLDVHHKTYERRGRELRDDLIVLCGECHRQHHFGGAQ